MGWGEPFAVAVPGRSPSAGGAVERRAAGIVRAARDAFTDAAGVSTEHEWLALVGRGNGLLSALAIVLGIDVVDAERVFTGAAGHLPAEFYGPPPAAVAPDRSQQVRAALDALVEFLDGFGAGWSASSDEAEAFDEAVAAASQVLVDTAGDWRAVHTSPEDDPALLKLMLSDARSELARVRAERDRARRNLDAAVAPPARRGGGFPLTYSPACDGGDYPKEARL